MRGLRLSLLANLGGAVWSALIGLLVVPIYLRLLGIEAYGLIGLFLTLQNVLQILDLGLSPTLSRELARRSHTSDASAETRDLVRTFEVVSWIVALGIGIVGVLATSQGATAWIRSQSLSPGTVRQALMMMALLAAVQWPLGFYQGGLRGLERQGLVNALQIAGTTTGAIGAICVLSFYEPSISAFWTWQIINTVGRVMLARILLWRCLPMADRAPRIDLAIARHVWRFAAGMSGITMTGIVLANLDKIVLSRLLPLNLLGYYLLAAQVTSALSMVVVGPVFNTVFPRFSALAAQGDRQTLASTYHRMTQVMAVLTLPLAGLLIVFAEDILSVWTGDPLTAQHAAPVLRWLVAGTAVNSMMNLPYALQLGFGWTRLGLQINVALLCGLIPSLWLATRYFGAVGAAAAWFGLNVVYMAVGVVLTHRRLLPGETGRWFSRDFVWPGLVSLALLVALRVLVEAPSHRIWHIAQLGGILTASIVAAALAAGDVRAWGLRQISRLPAAPGS